LISALGQSEKTAKKRKDSKEEKNFITSLTKGFSNINSLAIRTKEGLESLVQQIASIFENA